MKNVIKIGLAMLAALMVTSAAATGLNAALEDDPQYNPCAAPAPPLPACVDWKGNKKDCNQEQIA